MKMKSVVPAKRFARALVLGSFLVCALSLQCPALYADPILGSFTISEPWGPPDYDFLFYDLSGIDFSGDRVTMKSNDHLWISGGWPGAVMDKIFFAPASATEGGIFTADVEVTIDGKAFPAVINPDLGDLLLPGSVNTTGEFYGDPYAPEWFGFSELPVYAIVPYGGSFIVDLPEQYTAWSYDNPLWIGEPWQAVPNFSLAMVGTLSIDAVTGSYELTEYSFTEGFDQGPESVPEPASILLLGSGLIGLMACRKRGR